ncbi:PREDICTED: tectonin beta-propeller repeat-containing protein 2 [Thamnophis sirtalis]|uniref:Tectonin beta-propeller repeat-containing protein 2 n=1 Tax=Thamnophis sirtalis TaxID=35019 RepID=A0A6I9YWI2_9SAUR|nr:PREDICTED: tectonin beta-propeller repeat-containing protein 2 [Thamnophis sirtalis]XP_013929008.1 PREDICTED: tectonin beta-propeller repeat-containing protein 2 [Thamnophis sirtalis]
MASVIPSFIFKEFCPLYYLLNAIPTKIQKGFRSIVVYLTALDTNEDYIAVGSSIGMLYLYCRHLNQMKKYNFEGKNESITIVKLLNCFDDLVAVGTVSGKIAIFQLVSSLPGRNKQLRRFNVSGFHKSSITALAWSPNGMKLFSGDDRGKIVYSALDLDQGLCNSSLILEEPSSIVQLDYSQKVLLISTLQRTVLFYTEEKSVKQVGTQPRKTTGKFGACFIPGLRKQSDLMLFAARPGIRLWKSDVHGMVQATYLLKDVFAAGMKSFELYPRAGSFNKSSCNFPERQFGLISCFSQEGWVLSWNEYSIYVLDTINQTMIGSLEGCGDIVSVSCTENEIFLLKGDRDIIRISSRPEGLVSIDMNSQTWTSLESDLSPKLERPHLVIASVSCDPSPEANPKSSNFSSPQTPSDKNGFVGRADQEVALIAQKIRSQSFDALGNLSTDPRRRGYSVVSESRSRSSSMNSVDSGSSSLTNGDQTSSEIQKVDQQISQRLSLISSEDFNQELIIKPIKVKKKKKKKPENGTRRNPTSLESTPSYEQQAFTDSFQILNVKSCSISSSLQGSTTDCLSICSTEQGSVFSMETQNDTETFSVLQSLESIVALTPDDNKDTLELLNNLSNCENEEYASPVTNSCLLVVENKMGSDLSEHNWTSLSEKIETSPKQIFPNEDHFPLLRKTECTLDELHLPDTLASLEETNSAIGTSVNRDTPFCTDELFVQSEIVEVMEQQPSLRSTVPGNPEHYHAVSEKERNPQEGMLTGQDFKEGVITDYASEWMSNSHSARAERCASSDEEDIYGHGLIHSSSETNVTEMGACHLPRDKVRSNVEKEMLSKSDQFAESWMGYAGPGYGILSLVVSDKYIWCLDYKGSLYCSALPSAGLRWQKFEDNVQQMAVSPSGTLLWKIEQKTNKAFACGKVTIRGKRHWYEALPQAAFVSLSDDTAWIIRTNGDLYLQTGLSVDRPCARAVKVDCPYQLSQITARNNIIWALTEQRVLLFREGVSSFCPEGEQWKCDIISEMQSLEPVCITLGDQQTIWILDIHGNLWFRTGVVSKKPQGDDNHWWQVSITDYVVFDQCSLFQTIIHATQTVATAAQAPVEKVADKLRTTFWSQQLQCQPSLLAVNSSGVWISSGKNEFHVAKGNLIGTYWNNVVPRGTASATKWAFVLASAAPTKEGSFLWLSQSSKDLFCVSDQNPQFHPSTVQLPSDNEMVYYSACRDAIWSLNSLGQVFIRTLSPNCPTGMHWTKLDLSQLGAVKLISLACGNQHIWACDSCGGIYFRVGSQPLNPNLMLPAWIMIEPPIQAAGVHLIRVYSSPNDQSLWAIDNKCNVHVRTGITEEMPVGTDWDQVPGLQANELVISMKTVWARCPNGDIARRYGITDKNPAGDYWKKIPGNVSCLAVTPLDELWAIGSSGNLIHRLTKTFQHSHNMQKHSDASISFHSDDFEDEWEVI